MIARNSSFAYRQPSPPAAEVCRALGTRYLVTGTVRRSGAVVRITADLVDGHNNETLWSQRFDSPLTDLFEAQNQISTSIVSAVGPVYLRREALRTSRSEASDMQYWELLMRARWHFWRTTRENIDASRACLAKALEARQGLRASKVDYWRFLAVPMRPSNTCCRPWTPARMTRT